MKKYRTSSLEGLLCESGMRALLVAIIEAAHLTVAGCSAD